MTTTIKNISTGEIIETSCTIDGIDILGDVMGSSGIEVTALTDEEIGKLANAGNTNTPGWAYALDDDDVDWWVRWAQREERINAAYEEASKDARAACEAAISELGHDFEALQDAQEAILGLDGSTMQAVAIDADNTISGNYVNAPLRSCRPVDQPTSERITVTLDGVEYERTVYERVIWRNSGKRTVSARFVIINGTNYLI